MNNRDKDVLANVVYTYGVDAVLTEIADLFRGGPVTAVQDNDPVIVKYANVARAIDSTIDEIDNIFKQITR